MSENTVVRDDLRYTKDHEWLKRDENNDQQVFIGITDHAQSALGDIVFVEFPSVGDLVSPGDEIGVIESAKSASEIFSPVTGKIVEVNDELDSNPEAINSDPYDAGWIVKIEMEDPDELDQMLSPDGYTGFLQEE